MSVSVKDLLNGLQKTLLSKLKSTRELVQHSGTKGNIVEYDWIKTLGDFLPKRYQVNKAFIIDAKGSISEQIDIVIYDSQYSPLIFNHSECKYIPAESVYAIFEVKQNLCKDHIEYACNKIDSVRKLSRTSSTIIHAGGNYKPKPLHNIVGGIICSESDWKPSFGKPFINALIEFSHITKLDIGCSLNDGSFVVEWDSNNPEIECSSNNDSLMFFLIRLMVLLQNIGTVPAIDLLEYSKSLNTRKIT